MKVLVLGLMISLSAVARPVFLVPTCNWGPAYGECRLWNTSRMVVGCELITQGQTRMGSYINLPRYDVLYQGMTMWTSVNANNPYIDPIVFMSATAICNTMGR